MRVLVVMVHRNELNQQRVDVPPHELPLLGFVHGEEQCKVIGELTVDRQIPTADEEYSRLAMRYGRDKANESMEPRVAAVYGAGVRGVRALQEAIDYGQNLDVPLEELKLGSSGGELAHGTANPLRSTQIRPMAHTGPVRGKTKRRGGPIQGGLRPREGLGAEGVRSIPERPAAMQPGAAGTLHKSTTKSKRKAAGMAGGSAK